MVRLGAREVGEVAGARRPAPMPAHRGSVSAAEPGTDGRRRTRAVEAHRRCERSGASHLPAFSLRLTVTTLPERGVSTVPYGSCSRIGLYTLICAAEQTTMSDPEQRNSAANSWAPAGRSGGAGGGGGRGLGAGRRRAAPGPAARRLPSWLGVLGAA